jgi:hypothetical protein
MDYYGSGPGWHIHYLWPAGSLILKNPNAWEFFSWQNLLAALLLLIWTIVIALWPYPGGIAHASGGWRDRQQAAPACSDYSLQKP